MDITTRHVSHQHASQNGAPGNVAEALVAQLAAAGVKRVYGDIGDGVFPLAGALQRQTEVQFIAATDETNAAYMASYDAKLTGHPGVCMATSGPGATNLATGLAHAYFDGAPVLAITGQVETSRIGTEAKQYFDQQTFFRPVTASSELVLSGEAALHATVAALHRAAKHKTATHLSVPKDVFEQPLQWTPLPLQSPPAPEEGMSDTGPWRVLGNEAEAIRRLREARRPLLLLGTVEPDAVRESLALADALGAAVVTAQQAKGAVPYEYERLIGGIGEAHVPPIVTETDLLVLVGEAPYELRFIPPTISSVVIASTYKGLRRRPLIAQWIGDTAKALAYVGQQMTDVALDPAWRRSVEHTRRELAEQIELLPSGPTGTGCNPYRLAFTLSEHVAEDAIITVDVGAFSHWFDLGFRTRRQTVLSSPYWRGIGFALPAAIGAQLAHPDRQVVAIVGDGALLQSMAEWTTAVRYQLPLTLVVVNNATYDIERQKMEQQGHGTLGTELPTPDFVAYATACGAKGVRVDSGDELDEALKQSFGATHRHPLLIDVRTTVPALPHLVGAH